MQDKIIELEKKVAFIDHKLEELNEVIFDQAKVIASLQSQLKNVHDQMASGALVRKLEDEDAPPHY